MPELPEIETVRRGLERETVGRADVLDEGLDLFAGEAYAGVELDVDLKLPGYEREVIEGDTSPIENTAEVTGAIGGAICPATSGTRRRTNSSIVRRSPVSG